MLISKLIKELQQQHKDHGDVDVIVYDEDRGRDLEDISIEYNVDSGEKVIIVAQEDA
jgi:hypothetical protein